MEYFSKITDHIRYEGPQSNNPLAFRYYDENKVVGHKTMKDHLRFAVAYWHTLNGEGSDPFGEGVYHRPWKGDTMASHKNKMMAAFEFFKKLNVPYWCFHDRDIAPEGNSFQETCRNLKEIVSQAKKLQNDTGVKLLWGTANLFSHARFNHGAMTNPNAKVYAYAAAQVKNALDATLELGGENFVFWGGREGYETLLNTNYEKEIELMANFFHMVVDYKKEIGFKGPFLIEPKPKEPMKHMYAYDCSTVIGFLKKYDLTEHFKLNIEVNHATLAGHTFEHEITIAQTNNMLGSLDVNYGDTLLGWDTDQFLMDVKQATVAMLVILKGGGLKSGGMNFDAKLRRGSTDINDLFYAHIGAMDIMAKGLLIAQKMIENGQIEKMVADRYHSYNSSFGASIINRKTSLRELESLITTDDTIDIKSGSVELFEMILNRSLDNL
jgi:xylose isomerase